MKNTLLVISVLFTFVGCAGVPTQAPERKPAGDSPLGNFLESGDYQSPPPVSPPGFNRPSKVFLPTNYSSRDKWPVILMLHGYTSDAQQADILLGLSKRVTPRGFILLTPEGTKFAYDDPGRNYKKGSQFWNATDFCCDLEKTGVDDVGYLLGLIKETAARFHVDPERIYLFGHSNGGFMVNRLLCETDGVFAGAVSLAGGTYKDPRKCRLVNPVSYLQVHSENDPTVAYGDSPDYAGGHETVLRRVSAAGCNGGGQVGAQVDYVFSIPGLDTTPTTWNNCRNGTEVGLWTIKSYSSFLHAPHHPWFYDIAGDEAINFLFRHTASPQTP